MRLTGRMPCLIVGQYVWPVKNWCQNSVELLSGGFGKHACIVYTQHKVSGVFTEIKVTCELSRENYMAPVSP